MGYFLGSINPSYILAKKKNINLKEIGSGNLGLTNATMVLGKKSGVIVLIVDFFKGFLAVITSLFIFKRTKVIALLVGAFAIIGHIFPFYLNFSGGKGLLTFIGVMFAYDPMLCISVFLLSCLVTVIINYSVAMPYSITTLFCVLATLKANNIYITLICIFIALIIQLKHLQNYKNAKAKEDIKVSDYFNKFVFENKNQDDDCKNSN